MMGSMTRSILLLLSLVSLTTVTAFAPTILPPKQLTATSTQLFQTPVQDQEEYYLQLAVQNEGNTNTPEMIYILVYNPYTDEEGVHTTEYPKESGKQALLVFEALEDCRQMASLLAVEPSVPGEPVPTPAPLAQMEMACQQMEWTIKVVPATA
ncbi:expressed unknown protein [Seminavis robusta]|uniref:CARDB domain-containing protein n=1 Tax=Seminavis robusta TaxID=568900 RepID=A0A9N8DS80_9STRA|nr:expressed unknown protein [Seminavis robusta]|eukprot:Sro319_g116120.1 n/a (153) ;mRNA; f:6966-7518